MLPAIGKPAKAPTQHDIGQRTKATSRLQNSNVEPTATTTPELKSASATVKSNEKTKKKDSKAATTTGTSLPSGKATTKKRQATTNNNFIVAAAAGASPLPLLQAAEDDAPLLPLLHNKSRRSTDISRDTATPTLPSLAASRTSILGDHTSGVYPPAAAPVEQPPTASPTASPVRGTPPPYAAPHPEPVSRGGYSAYDMDDYYAPTTGRSTANGTRRLRDMEPNSVEYVYERHRRRCRTTTPTSSLPTSAQRQRGNHNNTTNHEMSLESARRAQADATFSSMIDNLGVLDEETRRDIREKLLPKKIVEDAFDMTFSQRLKHVVARNKPECLIAAQAHRDQLLQDLFQRGSELVERHEQRVHDIEEHQRNHQAAKREAHLQGVRQSWLESMRAVQFATGLMDYLQSLKSIATLKRTMLPLVIRKAKVIRKRWDRQAITEMRLDDNPVPTPSMIRQMQGQFFEGWSDQELNGLIRTAKPVSFLEGEYLMFEGDYDRVMYLITKGSVEVQIRDKKLKEKRRRAEFSAARFPVQAPAYVGEFALLCKEPRSASIQCITDVDTWVVSAKNFDAVVELLSPEIAQKQQEATDLRRKANLRKYFSLRPEVIRKNKYFSGWDLAVLRDMSAALEPLVLRANNRLYREGEYEPALYFIADGKIRMTKPTEPSEPHTDYGPGDVIGAFETFFVQERRSQTATCLVNCDLWKLTRQQLLDLGMSDPGSLVASKFVVQESKTADMYKLPKAPAYVTQDPYLSFILPTSQLQILWQLGVPRVVGAGEHLSIEGDDAKYIYFVVLGSFHISHLDKDLKKYDDKVVVSPILGGVHTGAHYTNDNLKSMFPSVTYCEIPKVGSQAVKPLKSFRRQSVHQTPGGGPLAGTTTSSSMRQASKHNMSAASLGLDSNLTIAQKEGCIGVVLGAYEFAARQSRWNATYRCSSMCEVFVVEREALEAQLPEPLVQMHRSSTLQTRILIESFLNRNAASLLALPAAQKVTGLYLAMKAQEKQKDKTPRTGKQDKKRAGALK
ncbi:cyclic nucleotide-binding protein, putative [Bodo saltans]|uniref:Cyclic nucleotide-binding protein, putative n=1 Tax=Bodo saltans TaxID=75058 RepID=A0A0S4JPP7_BODSA|nr:cyclic nucleotide-binding protein, putative [Bodo saltans]|eukprot:CUG91343.1 cyclic nucleotide-binding protein, putative [Bodo saltans]